jgi:hypothetical protein
VGRRDRMRSSRLGGLLLLLGIVSMTGCDESSEITPPATPPGYPLAYVMQDCAPWDGPALAIVLTSQPLDSLETVRPLLRLMIYPRGESMPGHTYRWPAQPEMAAASRCTSADSCAAATAGQVTLTVVRPDSLVEGRLALRFANGEKIMGGFRAAWLRRRAMCG